VSSILELVAGLAIAAVAVFFVLRPIITPPVPGRDSTPPGLEEEDPEDDLSARSVALRALKEIEFDRATGKLSDADYDTLKAQYTAEALVALRADSAAASDDTPDIPRPRAGAPAAARATCPTHGLRPEADARYCSACGRRLSTATGFCGKCGSALEPDARFCAACGRRVAA
jgi:double zinc ribbon protein